MTKYRHFSVPACIVILASLVAWTVHRKDKVAGERNAADRTERRIELQ